eukprot:TRINITY_DN6953_c0_g1_i1.p1 TRINITY_DN6953_c0_g1~~TRINITY_DN6953_c0_g1_i1.p1  ORF type:complete len:124 (-),score=19.92 TRINITY_DN6953_c0_g1_i1:460-831(-)
MAEMACGCARNAIKALAASRTVIAGGEEGPSVSPSASTTEGSRRNTKSSTTSCGKHSFHDALLSASHLSVGSASQAISETSVGVQGRGDEEEELRLNRTNAIRPGNDFGVLTPGCAKDVTSLE